VPEPIEWISGGPRMGEELVSARQAILDVVSRYFIAIDHRDWEVLRTCFAADVTGIYEGVQVAGGVDRLMDFFEGRSTFGFPVEIIDLQVSMHFIGTHAARIEGERAFAETYCLAHLVDRPGDEPRLRTRGLRYVDELACIDGGWVIRHRRHILDWTRADRLEWAAPSIEPLGRVFHA
jgi:hypothetical protein